MSARAGRMLAIPFSFLAFALRLVEHLWLRPVSWRVDSTWLGLLVALAFTVTALLIPLGGYLLLTRSVRRRPPRWHVEEQRRVFSAGATPYASGASIIVLGWMAEGVMPTDRVPGEDRMRIADIGAYTTVGIAMTAAALLIVVLLAVIERPVLTLDREGITVQGRVRRTRVRWTEMAAGRVVWSRPVNPDTLDLQLESLRNTRIPARALHIVPEFLAYTITTYAEAPDRRADIGTEAESGRLETGYHAIIAG